MMTLVGVDGWRVWHWRAAHCRGRWRVDVAASELGFDIKQQRQRGVTARSQ